MASTKSPQSVQKMFGRIAKRYDRFNRLSSFFIDQLWRKKAISYLPKTQGLETLDLCAGTLDLSLILLKQNPSVQITALDFSEEMLREGARKIPQKYREQIQICVGDALELPFDDNRFDAVICAFGMRNLADLQRGLEQTHRVLRPLGKIIVLEFFKPSSWVAKLFYATYGRVMIPILGRWLTQDQNAYDYLFRSIQSFVSFEPFCKLVESSGFTVTHQKTLSGGIAQLMVAEKKTPSLFSHSGSRL